MGDATLPYSNDPISTSIQFFNMGQDSINADNLLIASAGCMWYRNAIGISSHQSCIRF
jgi:hypothetical protein